MGSKKHHQQQLIIQHTELLQRQVIKKNIFQIVNEIHVSRLNNAHFNLVCVNQKIFNKMAIS